MWRVERKPRLELPDLDRFVQVVNRHADLFARDRRVYVARAPGRLDLMGGIADYSGALVLELPLSVATFVAAQTTSEPSVTVRSTAAAELGAEPEVSVSLEALASDPPPDYAGVHRALTADRRRSWVAYAAGTIAVLCRERGIRFDRGVRLLVHSEVPTGAGVSSSAALEVATMHAVCGAFELTLEARELALLCQKVENAIVGAPCGIMDQMTVACGEANCLYALLCQPAEPQPPVVLPPDVEVWGIASGIRHAVSGADYGGVRVGAFMGYRIIAARAGLGVESLAAGRVRIEDPRWRGYLTNVSPAQWADEFEPHVPVEVNGADFIERYGGITDAVTRIDPNRTYAVRAPTAHPIHEHDRVCRFRALLQNQPPTDDDLRILGELMYESHASYGACGLGSDGTDRIVELVREAGPAAGLYGGKITGGGSGGTVAVLARRGAGQQIRALAHQYERETRRPSLVLGGSSPGAARFGQLELVSD
jgi:L-arabinokinase